MDIFPVLFMGFLSSRFQQNLRSVRFLFVAETEANVEKGVFPAGSTVRIR